MQHLLDLLLSSLLVSALSFGGGVQALFHQTMVLQNHFITNNDLVAVLSFGYATPGPAVFSIATFVGYHVSGLPGAVIGSVGIFLLPCISALLTARYLRHWLDSPHAAHFIRGVGLAAAGVVAATALTLVHPHSMSVWHIMIMACSCFAVLRWSVHPVLVLVTGGLLGLL